MNEMMILKWEDKVKHFGLTFDKSLTNKGHIEIIQVLTEK